MSQVILTIFVLLLVVEFVDGKHIKLMEEILLDSFPQ
jgi:hypothetical protein